MGEGVTQDYEQAAYWYNKSAEQGNAYAQKNLGNCYYWGNGITQDYEQAVNWFRKSANQGNAEAQANMGFFYYYGQGVAESLEQSIYWLEKATEQGFSIVDWFHFEDLANIINNNNFLFYQFLGQGTQWGLGRKWSNSSGSYISFYNEDGNSTVFCASNIPRSGRSYYQIENGKRYSYDDWEDKILDWQFTVISMNQIEVSNYYIITFKT